MSRPALILIVDDSASEIDSLRNVILETDWNAEIEGLSCVPKIMERLMQFPRCDWVPDLILMNFRMGRETAISLLTRLRSAHKHTLPPLVIFSGTPLQASLKDACYRLGAVKILQKPDTHDGAKRFINQLRFLLSEAGDISSGGSWTGDVAADEGDSRPKPPVANTSRSSSGRNPAITSPP